MTRRRVKPFIKPAVFALIAVAVLAYMISTCSWFEGRPPPAPDPDVQAGKLVRLTHTDDIRETNPVWSPRGDKIAFECADYDLGGFWPFSRSASPAGAGVVRNWPITIRIVPVNICVMNADGTGRVQLTDDETDATDPAWHPNGDKVAFSSYRDRIQGIDVVNADGSGRVRLADGFRPAWSPDGRLIAFSSVDGDSSNIYVMNADGSGRRQVIQDEDYAEEPTWSPDGNKIAFTLYRSDGSHVYVVDLDGSNRTRISDGPGRHTGPVWSPDGTRIAYATYDETNNSSGDYLLNADGSSIACKSRPTPCAGIYLASADGSEPIMLHRARPSYEPCAYVRALAWSPDGNRIAFDAGTLRSANACNSGYVRAEIKMINVDGSGLRRLTQGADWNSNPTWNPAGNKIAFASDRVKHTEIYVIPYS